ncbi:MAG: alpha/beta hydrolase [Hyphomicrobium sp.]
MLDLATTETVRDARLTDRMSLRYKQVGSGKPLVLLHTIRTQLDYFDKIVPILAKDFTVYAVDLPGHGHSSIDTRASYDEPYFRSAIVSFIEKLDLRDVTLVGESIGGVLALTVAGELPDRVKAVVASNPYDYDHHYADGVRRGNVFANIAIGSYAMPFFGAINAALENKLFLGWVLRGGLYNKRSLPRDLLAELDRVGRRRGYRYVERKTFSGWRSWSNARALYKNVKAPVTFIYGEQDWSRPEERARNSAELPQAPMNTLPQTGHFAVLEHPRKIAEIIAGPTERTIAVVA